MNIDTLNQNLYRWAITQVLATRKFDIILQALIKYHTVNLQCALDTELVDVNPKDKKRIAKTKQNIQKEINAIRKDYTEYSKLNKKMVERFAEMDNNVMIQLAADKMDAFLTKNVEIVNGGES